MIKKNTIPGIRNFFLCLVFILSASNCFAQFADTSELNTYVRDTIKDRRPAKVTALQVQKALLGTSNLFAAKADKKYKEYFVVVSKSGATFTKLFEEKSDFGSTTFTFSNPANGWVHVTASSAVFTSNKTFSPGSAVDNAGQPYFLTGQPDVSTPTTVYNFRLILHDGTQTGTPNFDNATFVIRVYN
jgi:hypothetical protein